MSAADPRAHESIAYVFLGFASLVLASGGAAATAALWDLAPPGARVAMVVLDASLALFVLAAVVSVVYGLSHRDNRGHSCSRSTPTPRARPQHVQLRIARQLASELDATLVRRRDGTYCLKIGPVPGRIPNGYEVAWPETYSNAAEAATHAWLTMMADSLDAELLYDGKCMEWYLHWPSIQEAAEEDFY